MTSLRFEDTKFMVGFSRIVSLARDSRPILLGAGREVGNRLKRHFRQKDKKEANRLSDRRSHFWLAVSRTVSNPDLSGNTVTVTINHPAFAQKVFGGTITPKEKDALTIPVEERAYDRRPAVFEAETGLKLFLIQSGKGAFATALLAVKDAGGKGFTVEYILTKSVTQKADTDALPQKSQLEAAILSRGQKVLDRQLAGENPETESTES